MLMDPYRPTPGQTRLNGMPIFRMMGQARLGRLARWEFTNGSVAPKHEGLCRGRRWVGCCQF
jgi:hypothetical protein